MWIIILITIIIIVLIFIVHSIKYNKFEELIIRINEAEANIDSILNKRFDLLNKSIGLIKSNTKTDKEVLEDIVKLRSRKLNNFELDTQLNKAYKEFKYYADNFENLKDNDSFTKIEIDLIESEANIVALKKYYNDITEKYNYYTSKFPSSMIAKFKKYNKKELFEIAKEDDYSLVDEIIFEDEKNNISEK